MMMRVMKMVVLGVAGLVAEAAAGTAVVPVVEVVTRAILDALLQVWMAVPVVAAVKATLPILTANIPIVLTVPKNPSAEASAEEDSLEVDSNPEEDTAQPAQEDTACIRAEATVPTPIQHSTQACTEALIEASTKAPGQVQLVQRVRDAPCMIRTLEDPTSRICLDVRMRATRVVVVVGTCVCRCWRGNYLSWLMK